MSKVTIQDVARLAGVSPSTISNYFNERRDQMRPDTQKRISDAVKTLGYVPNVAARHLKTGHSSILGLLIPTVVNPFFGELSLAVEQAAKQRGYRLILCNTLRDAETEQRCIQDLIAHGVRGILTVSGQLNKKVMKQFIQDGIAFLAFDAAEKGLVTDVVTIDNYQCAVMLSEYLIRAGHRSVMYVCSDTLTLSRQERISGYSDTMTKHHLKEQILKVSTEHLNHSHYGDADLIELGGIAAEQILAQGELPSAVIGMNDMVAIGIMTRLREKGIAVPQQISVIGIDDIHFSSLITPTLTTMRQPFEELAETAVNILLRRIDAPSLPVQHVKIVPHLMVRESSRELPSA